MPHRSRSVDDDDILFLTNAETVKGRNLLREPRVTLVIDDETPPFAFVMIEGTAVVSRDVTNLDQVARRISQRYDAGEGIEDSVVRPRRSRDAGPCSTNHDRR